LKTRSLIIVGTILGLAFALGVARKYAAASHEAQLALDILAANRSRVAGELRHWNERAAAQAPAPVPTAGVLERIRKLEQAEESSENQALHLAAAQSRARRDYLLLTQNLRLTPDQTTRFLDNLAHRDAKTAALNAALRSAFGAPSQVPPAARESVRELRSEISTDYLTAQQDLLGPAGYAQLQDYERALPAQNTVAALAGSAAITGSPFTPEQAQQLKQLLLQHSRTYQEGGRATTDDLDWDALNLEAQSFLSDPQMNVLRNIGAPTEGRPWSQFRHAFARAQSADAAKSSP